MRTDVWLTSRQIAEQYRPLGSRLTVPYTLTHALRFFLHILPSNFDFFVPPILVATRIQDPNPGHVLERKAFIILLM